MVMGARITGKLGGSFVGLLLFIHGGLAAGPLAPFSHSSERWPELITSPAAHFEGADRSLQAIGRLVELSTRKASGTAKASARLRELVNTVRAPRRFLDGKQKEIYAPNWRYECKAAWRDAWNMSACVREFAYRRHLRLVLRKEQPRITKTLNSALKELDGVSLAERDGAWRDLLELTLRWKIAHDMSEGYLPNSIPLLRRYLRLRKNSAEAHRRLTACHEFIVEMIRKYRVGTPEDLVRHRRFADMHRVLHGRLRKKSPSS